MAADRDRIAALIVVGGLVALGSTVTPLAWFIRTCAVLGYLCVFVAALSSIYMRELVRWFGRSFVKTHHVVTVTGLVLLTLHPLAVAWNFGSPSVLIPQGGSWMDFFRWGGRWAWYLIGIASLVAFFGPGCGISGVTSTGSTTWPFFWPLRTPSCWGATFNPRP